MNWESKWSPLYSHLPLWGFQKYQVRFQLPTSGMLNETQLHEGPCVLGAMLDYVTCVWEDASLRSAECSTRCLDWLGRARWAVLAFLHRRKLQEYHAHSTDGTTEAEELQLCLALEPMPPIFCPHSKPSAVGMGVKGFV